MSELKRCESAPIRGDSVTSSSVAAREAFDCLNAGTRVHWRGAGDSKTAARDRAAGKAGVTPAQAERLWKNWRHMKSVDGDVYRLLRNTYGHLCSWVENVAERIEREAREIEEANETETGARRALAGVEAASRRAAE